METTYNHCQGITDENMFCQCLHATVTFCEDMNGDCATFTLRTSSLILNTSHATSCPVVLSCPVLSCHIMSNHIILHSSVPTRCRLLRREVGQRQRPGRAPGGSVDQHGLSSERPEEKHSFSEQGHCSITLQQNLFICLCTDSTCSRSSLQCHSFM